MTPTSVWPDDDPCRSAGPIPFAQFREEVLDLYRPPMRAQATFLKMRQGLDLAAELLGPNATTAAITPVFVARFIASRPATQSRNTIRNLLAVLRAAFSYAMQMQYVRVSPFVVRKEWVRKEKPRRAPRHLSAAEVARLLARADQEVRNKGRHPQAGQWAVWRTRRLHAVVATAVYTGMRKNEVLTLKRKDIDLKAGLIHVVSRAASRLKTAGSERVIPVAPALAPILRDWLTYSEMSEWAFPNSTFLRPWIDGHKGYKPLERLKALGKRASIPGLTFHALRHTFATMAESRWGLSREQIARLLGHTSLSTQDRYRHEDVDNLKGLAGRIDFGPMEGSTDGPG